MSTMPELLIDQGRYLEALTHLKAVIKDQDNRRAQQLYALCLSKSGSAEAALEHIEPFYRHNPADAETAGILGSIYKELFKKNQRPDFATRSRDTYLKNFESTKSYYTGINAASMSAMMMQGSKSRDLASQVIAMINPATTNFWELCTLGEAYLITKDKAKAISHYLKARNEAVNDWGKIASAYNQLWLLNHYIPVPAEILQILSPPIVVAFAGHMMDQDADESRFPRQIEKQVKEAITAQLKTLNAHIGYASLACGGDILFAEAILALGGEFNAIIPFKEEDFIRRSVTVGGNDWLYRYQNVKKKSNVKFVTNENSTGHDELFALAGKVIMGNAILRSNTFNNQPYFLSVLSGTDLTRKVGGTRDIVPAWPFPRTHVNIDPDVFNDLRQIESAGKTRSAPQHSPDEKMLLYLLYADFTGLSALDREKLKKEINQLLSTELNRHFKWHEEREELLIGFETEFTALTVLQSLTQRRKALTTSSFKAVLHLGIVYLKSPMQSTPVLVLNEIFEHAQPGTICASDLMAASAALHPGRFKLQFAGTFVCGEERLTLYSVN